MTIDELQQNLETWRKNKKSTRDRIPQEYWDAVIRLSATHSLSQLGSKLNLNSNEIKRRMGTPPEKKIIFKELSSLPAQGQERKLVFELSTASGLTLKVYQ